MEKTPKRTVKIENMPKKVDDGRRSRFLIITVSCPTRTVNIESRLLERNRPPTV